MSTATKIKPLMTLSAKKKESFILDRKNVKHYFVHMDDLGLIDRSNIEKHGQELSLVKDIKSKKDEEHYNGTLKDILCIILPSLKSQLNTVSVVERIDIVSAYMEDTGLIKKKVQQITKGPRAKKKKR